MRSRRSSASASSGKVVSPRSRAERPSAIVAADAVVAARRTPASSNSSRIAARNAARATGGARSPPRASDASAAERTERPARPGAASSGSTRPPGKTWASDANAIVVGRCVRRTSSPAEPGRSRTTVAAGRASTGPAVTRAPRTATTWTTTAGRPAQPSAAAAASSWARSAAGIGHRQPAHEAAADVGRRAPIERDPVRQQRDGGGPRIGRQRDDLVGVPAAPDLRDEGGRGRIIGRADDGDLHDRPQREVHRRQPLGEPRRIAGHVRHHRAQGTLAGGPVLARPGPGREPQQDASRHRVARRDGVVLDVLGPGHEPLVIVGRIEEPAVRIDEPGEHAIHQRTGEMEPSLLE